MTLRADQIGPETRTNGEPRDKWSIANFPIRLSKGVSDEAKRRRMQRADLVAPWIEAGLAGAAPEPLPSVSDPVPLLPSPGADRLSDLERTISAARQIAGPTGTIPAYATAKLYRALLEANGLPVPAKGKRPSGSKSAAVTGAELPNGHPSEPSNPA